jgi:predicted N-acyltransferase
MPSAGWTSRPAPGVQPDRAVTVTSRIVADFSSIDERDWARLEHADNPFLSRAFLAALETSGSVSPRLGWQPHHLALYQDDALVAFAPSYIKTNSHGEFVFDWAWADAYRRSGLPYYPKLLTAVPFSPVTGPRLLTARDHTAEDKLREGLAAAALNECRSGSLSSWHCNFMPTVEAKTLERLGLMPRHDWQFHWINRCYESFEHFLAGLKSRKRKNIRRERQQIARTGVTFEWKDGSDLSPADLELVYSCYSGTFNAYGNFPALNRNFFEILAATLTEGLQVAFAKKDGRAVAMGLFLQGGGRLYGRYWGALEDIPGLHFETAYYQGIEHCIRNGIEVFESGAQGEHKIARGFEPVQTHSMHYVSDPEFRRAIEAFVQRETGWLEGYREELEKLSPYRQDLA